MDLSGERRAKSGQEDGEYLASTWSCSGLSAASLHTFSYRPEKLCHVSRRCWFRQSLSVVNLSFSVLCTHTHTRTQTDTNTAVNSQVTTESKENKKLVQLSTHLVSILGMSMWKV